MTPETPGPRRRFDPCTELFRWETRRTSATTECEGVPIPEPGLADVPVRLVISRDDVLTGPLPA